MILALLACSTPDLPTARVVRRDVEARLTLRGELRSSDATRIRNRLPGWRSVAFIAEQGTRVEEGDLLLRMDTTEAEEENRELKEQLALHGTRIEQAHQKLVDELGKANASIVEARLDRELADLRSTDTVAVPAIQREQGRVDRLRSDLVIASADSDLQRIRSEAEAEIRLLEMEAVVMRDDIAENDLWIERAATHAKGPGVVLALQPWGEPITVGYRLRQGIAVLELPNVDALEVVAWVNEVDGVRLANGQRATVTLDAHVATIVEGVVQDAAYNVVAHGEHDTPQRRITLALDEVKEKMKPGMSVTLDVQIASWPDALVLPDEAVFHGSNERFVYTSFDERAPVRLLGRADGLAVIDGIPEGTEVLAFDPRAWARGERPR